MSEWAVIALMALVAIVLAIPWMWFLKWAYERKRRFVAEMEQMIEEARNDKGGG